MEDFLNEFREYKNYLESIKEKLLPDTYEFAVADWHYNNMDARCPHDAWLEEMKIYELAKGDRQEIRSTEIFVRLLGAYHNGHIELIYRNVKAYSLTKPLKHTIKFENTAKTLDLYPISHDDWLDDRIELTENNNVLHKIEWASAANWLIECENIEYKWIPFDPNQTNNMIEAANLEMEKSAYERIRADEKAGIYEESCGIMQVAGTEAVMFLNGLITNDVAKLENDSWMAAAFPNAQGRLLAAVRILRQNDKFLFVTEPETYEKVLANLSRFTLAGDFKVNDSTEKLQVISIRGAKSAEVLTVAFGESFSPPEENKIQHVRFNGANLIIFSSLEKNGFDIIAPKQQAKDLAFKFYGFGAVSVSDQNKEILRIENGIPKYGVDMDETTIVPELGIENLISYNKGCYIGQEIIARIHFRGHVAKRLTGLIFDDENAEINPNDELKSADEKNAGRVTSVTFSPQLGKKIALAYVRYDYLAEGTELKVGDAAATVKNLPFV